MWYRDNILEHQFKNRLVGTIVFVALGVIFLPDLLDGKKARVVEEFTEIPLRPTTQYQTSTEQTPEQFEVLDIASVDLGVVSDVEMSQPISTAPDEETEPLTDKTKNSPPVKPAVSAEPTAKAKDVATKTVKTTEKKSSSSVTSTSTTAVTAGYTLQLGGFNNAKNVSALVAQLRLSGYTAYTLPDTPVEGKLTRVFVGPEVSQAKLASRQEAIKKLTGLKGKIVPFNPMDK